MRAFQRQVLELMAARRSLWIGICLLGILSGMLSLAGPFVAKVVFDRAIPQRSVPLLAGLGILELAIVLTSLGCNVLSNYWTTALIQGVTNALQARVYGRILALPLAALQRRESGDLMSVINNDVPRAVDLARMLFIAPATEGLSFVFCFAMIFALRWQLGVCVLVFIPFYVAAFGAFRRPLRSAGEALPAAQGAVSQTLHEGLNSVRLLKVLNAEGQHRDRLARGMEIARHSLLRLNFLQSLSASLATTLMLGVASVFTRDYAGSITLGGVELRDLSLDALREVVGLVPQEEYFFNASIRDNIALGRPRATWEEIVEAARSAGADEFIRRLPNGYDSTIADCGSLLSAGQRQRIAIARALVRKPRILLLDECTSHLDLETERSIVDSLLCRANPFTVVLVTHSPNLVAKAHDAVILRDVVSHRAGETAESDHSATSSIRITDRD